MAYTLVVAEKPSVARDIARVLSAKEKGEGYYAGGNYRVTWAIGHLVSLCEPDEIDARYQKWRASDLPILPDQIPLKVLPKTKAQFNIVKRQMNDKDCDAIICATDAGREGELIFRYVYRMAGCTKPFSRLWISSMTDEAIREGFAAITPGSAYDNLYESARCRSEADWLVGMNASRAFTLRYHVLLSIGRVQTPTLALLVRRHHEIAAFVPKDYWTITADFGDYRGLWFDEATKEKRVYEAAKAEAIAAKVRGAKAIIESVSREAKKEMPPYLYDLTSLQRDANRLLRFTAQKTLATAQKLYEEHKLITYPRTDSKHLPRDMVHKTRRALSMLPEPYTALKEPLLRSEKLPMPQRIFDDKKVSDHHAILPTDKAATLAKLPPDERALYDLIVRRLLAAFYPAYCYDAVRVVTRAMDEPFESLGREVKQLGWKEVYADVHTISSKKKPDEEEATLPALTEGEQRSIKKVQVKAEKTKPPAPHTDASLLSSMEHAGREIEDEALRESMRNSGLGTPATRAAIMERLITVGYAERKGRAISATEKGVRLIAVVPTDIASPETTGRWEKGLSDITTGEMSPDRFLEGIKKLATALTESAIKAPSDIQFEKEEKKNRKRGSSAKVKPEGIGAVCPLCGQGNVQENSKAFYCARFREKCAFTIWKNAVIKAGGPMLTAALVKRLLLEGHVVGSTGTLLFAHNAVSFLSKQTENISTNREQM